jgi:drug/metabolite transporter (DMT)-like permease
VALAAASDRRRAGIALCVASACGFGLMAIFAKQAYRDGAGVTALLAARFVLAATVFWAIVGLRRAVRASAVARAAAGSSAVARTPRSAILTALALGAVGYSLQAICFFSAVRHIDASLASLLLYTYPALVCCGAVWLGREHITPWKAMALVVATAGTALVLLGGGAGGLEATGVMFGLGAAVTYAAYILVADSIVARIDPWLMCALVASGAAVTLVLSGVLTGSLDPPSAAAWVWIVAIALLSTVVALSAFLLGLERVGGPTASIVSTIEPVVTVSLAIVVFGEGFGPSQALGAVLVLGAVMALGSRHAGEGVSVQDHGAPAQAADLAPARAAARSAA